VGFAWSGGGDGAGAGRGQRGTGSSTTIAKFCSTDSGGAVPRSLSAAAAADRKDQRNLAALIMLSALTRTRIIGKQGDCDQPPWLELFYKESDSNERLRVDNWIVQRLDDYAVQETVEL
jgi:hypothetical protein